MEEIKPLNKLSFNPVGRCIYCNSRDELEDEHIIPYGFGGSAVLPKASCRKCAVKTGRFEQFVLRGEMWAVRTILGLSSRNKKSAPAELPITLIKDGKPKDEVLPLNRHPVILHLPIFNPPGILSGDDKEGISFRYMVTIGYGKPVKDVLRDEGADDLKITHSYKITEFAKLIAKIGWCMAAADGLLDIVHPKNNVINSMLNDENRIGKWVGGHSSSFERIQGTLHTVKTVVNEELGLLMAIVKLLSFSQTPTYVTVLGNLK